MAKIVCIHGIGQQNASAPTLSKEWVPAIQGGCQLAKGDVDPDDIKTVAYGHHFRPKGKPLLSRDEIVTPAELSEFERAILHQWWIEAARVDPHVISPDAPTLSGGHHAQHALRALSSSRFFSGLAERVMTGDLRQVHRYFTEPVLRVAIFKEVSNAITPDTALIVGHSLGSVVAYEYLCANPNTGVASLITLGSPLGIKNLIYDRLTPKPITDRKSRTQSAAWPPSITKWTNIADSRDIVALVKDLRPLFGENIHTLLIDNGPRAHEVSPYLTAQETGAAILDALRE